MEFVHIVIMTFKDSIALVQHVLVILTAHLILVLVEFVCSAMITLLGTSAVERAAAWKVNAY